MGPTPCVYWGRDRQSELNGGFESHFGKLMIILSISSNNNSFSINSWEPWGSILMRMGAEGGVTTTTSDKTSPMSNSSGQGTEWSLTSSPDGPSFGPNVVLNRPWRFSFWTSLCLAYRPVRRLPWGSAYCSDRWPALPFSSLSFGPYYFTRAGIALSDSSVVSHSSRGFCLAVVSESTINEWSDQNGADRKNRMTTRTDNTVD